MPSASLRIEQIVAESVEEFEYDNKTTGIEFPSIRAGRAFGGQRRLGGKSDERDHGYMWRA